MKINDFIVPTGKILLEWHNVVTGEYEFDLVSNMFVTAGKNSIAAGLSGDTTKGFITYCAVGTGLTAPALSDTQLETEIFRKLCSVRSVSGNAATFQTFYTTSEANGNLKELGLFGDNTASGTANSGTLYARNVVDRTKSSNDTLTLSWSITVG